MTIFARRDLQRLIEGAAFVRRGKLRDLVNQINRADEQSLANEWELVILAGLGRLGRTACEPELPGTSKVDFAFSPNGVYGVIGDVTTVSNRGYEDKNRVEPFRKEFFRRVVKKGLSPAGFETVFGGVFEGKYGAQHVRAMVPHPRDYPSVFDAAFERFLESVKVDRTRPHAFTLKSERWDVQIRFDPNSNNVSSSEPQYTLCLDREKNPLRNALHDKGKQLKEVAFEGLRCIVVCDGNADLLRSRPGLEVRPEQILVDFLRQNSSIDLVATVTIIEQFHNHGILPFAHGSLALHVRSIVNPATRAPGLAADVGRVFARLPEVLPPPATDALNAVAQLTWRYPGEGRPITGLRELRSDRQGETIVKIGSRAVLELLAGRLDSKTFLTRNRHFGTTDDPKSNIFAAMLREGRMISGIAVEGTEHGDDDLLVFHFGPPDPAIAPLTVPETTADE